MKKIIAYILLLSHIFLTGNIFIFFDYSPEKTYAATTTVTYSGTATDLADSTQSWVTPGNATGDTTSTSANMDIADRNVDTNTLALTNFNLSGA